MALLDGYWADNGTSCPFDPAIYCVAIVYQDGNKSD